MNTRPLSILIGTICIGAAAGIAFFSQGVLATELPTGELFGGTAVEPAVATGDHLDAAPAEGAFRRSEHGPVDVASIENKSEQTSGWTSGVIRGDIQLAVSVLDKLGSITIVVEEMRSPFKNGGDYKPPTRIYTSVERGRGTPTFEVRDVPFSDYPYRVFVRAAGLNGGMRTLSVTAKSPLHDIVLAITPGAPYSILLRDQDSGAHTGIDVLLRPQGLPNGRPRLVGKTDNFGSVIFDSVLAGGYELVATLGNQPFGDPEQVTVQPGTRNFGRKIQGQGHVMTIPRGVQLDVLVHDRFGYAMPGCTITASKTDTRRPNELEETTDHGGRLRFAHLQPGTWQITVQRDGFQRVDRQVTLRADQEAQLREIRLVRVRSR